MTSRSDNGDAHTRQRNVKTTTDLALMAFYLLRGLELVRATRKGESDQYVFHYDDPEDRAENLRIEWINSDLKRFDNEVRTLKKLTNENRRSNRRQKRQRRRQGSSAADNP